MTQPENVVSWPESYPSRMSERFGAKCRPSAMGDNSKTLQCYVNARQFPRRDGAPGRTHLPEGWQWGQRITRPATPHSLRSLRQMPEAPSQVNMKPLAASARQGPFPPHLPSRQDDMDVWQHKLRGIRCDRAAELLCFSRKNGGRYRD